MPLPQDGSIDRPTTAASARTAHGPSDPSIATAGAAPLPAPEHPVPKTGRPWWLWAAGGMLATGLGVLLYLQPWVASVTPVAVETVAPGPVTRVLAVNGRIAGVQSVDVRPQVDGTLAALLVVEGDVVGVGTALARIDPATQQAVVRQALAGLDGALVAKVEAEATYDRTKTLGSIAARVVLDNAARAVEIAEQEVARMTALLDQAEIQLGKYTIRAPLTGTVLVLTAEVGQTVDPAVALMTIADLDRLVVETDVDESYATQITVGQLAGLQLSGETVVRGGKVSFVSKRVEETTGGLAVEVTPDAALTAPIGLTVTANITVDDRPVAVTVPRAAIVHDADGDGVLVVIDGLARRRAVTVIEWPAARLIVTDGLAAGDAVIADATGIVDGQAVAVAR